MGRKARQSRPQLVYVLADNSGSMAGPKADAATAGIREMLLRCQTTGPRGPERSYFRLVLIRFGSTAAVDPGCNMTPVRKIDADSISIVGDGGVTDMTAALQLAYGSLQSYMTDLQTHAEREEHPLPLVLLFSDGFHNGPGDPARVAQQIKSFALGGDSVTIAAAGVATDASDKPDEKLLRKIASPDCYVHIERVQALSEFLAEVGSSGASSPAEVAQIVERLERQPSQEE